MTKQRKRKQGSLERSQPRFTGDRILIVCEDSKSAPSYFEFLRDKWSIEAAQILIVGKECGSDPVSVVQYAIDAKKNNIKLSRRSPELKYDQIWCVIDRDRHPNLNDALDRARHNLIQIALSEPCLEIWFLLHYRYTTKPYINYDDLRNDLKAHISNYDKGKVPNATLHPLLNTAKSNAKKLRKHCKETNVQNPSTQIDRLVIQLENAK